MKVASLFILSALFVALPLPSDSKELNPNNPLNPPAPVYWCPNKTPDQQIAATPDTDCSPLVEKESGEKENAPDGETKARKPVQIQNLQSEASEFLSEYRQFLECCANDVNSIDDLKNLQEQASAILRSIQETGLVNMGTSQRGITLREIIAPVAQAQDGLRKLKARLDRLNNEKETLGALGYEEAARERRRIQREETSITKDFRPARPPASARTGTEIEATTLPNRAGTTIETTTLPGASGSDIGAVVSPGSDQREDLRPRRGPDIEDTTLPNRYGPALGGGNTPASDLPSSIGAEIDSIQGPTGPSTNPSRVGPSIGDSSLNRR
ncbi:MAG: hypothetical protein ACREJU_13785 [Nitrospiraceae bacterium]